MFEKILNKLEQLQAKHKFSHVRMWQDETTKEYFFEITSSHVISGYHGAILVFVYPIVQNSMKITFAIESGKENNFIKYA